MRAVQKLHNKKIETFFIKYAPNSLNHLFLH